MELDIAPSSVLHEHTFCSNLEAAGIERGGLRRRLFPCKQGSDRLGRDRCEEDPVPAGAPCDEETLPLADQRPVVWRARAEARRGLDKLEVRDGRDGSNCLPK